MISVSILEPKGGSHIQPGTSQGLAAHVGASGIFSIPGSVDFEIKDAAQNRVYFANVPIAGDNAITICDEMPTTPGVYTLTATTEGWVANIGQPGTHAIAFEIDKAP